MAEKRKPWFIAPTPNNEINYRSEVQRILQTIKTYYEDNLWTKWINAYKNYLLYKIDRQMEIEDFQTNIKLPVIKMYIDAMWTWIYDNNLDFHVSWRNQDDHKNAEAVLNYTQWWFAVSNSRKHLMQSIKEALILWNGYGKIWFINNIEKISYNKWTTKVEKERKEQYPYIKYVSAFNIFHDPTVEYVEDSRYIIERKIMYKTDLYKQYNVFVPNIKSILDNREDSPYYFFAYDFNRVKYMAFWNKDTIKKFMQNGVLTDDFTIFYKNYLTIDFQWGYSEVIEYWEDNKFVLIVDWMVVYEWDNPLPIKKKPYFELHYNKIPWIPFGQWMATALEDIQAMADTIFNLTIDNIKLQVAPMFQKMKWWDIFEVWEKKLSYEPFKVIETNTPDAIQRLNLWSPDFSGTSMVQFLMQMWEMSEWINSYAIWYQNKVERSATWVSALVQSFKARLLPLTESLNSALSKIAEMWAVIWVAILPEEISVRILTTDQKTRFEKITMEDLIGKFDIEFDAQALKTATRETRRKQNMDLLTLASQAWFDPNTQSYFVDMKAIWKEVLDSFEMSSDWIIMNDKQVVKKQNDFKKAIQNWQKTSYNQAPQNFNAINPEQWWITAVEWESSEEWTYPDRPEWPPESEVLKEAYQSF